MNKEDYAKEAEQERHHMDNYRQYILEQLKIMSTNSGYKHLSKIDWRPFLITS
jgi:hypothetical protein